MTTSSQSAVLCCPCSLMASTRQTGRCVLAVHSNGDQAECNLNATRPLAFHCLTGAPSACLQVWWGPQSAQDCDQ
jgi:hypothetical protein